MTLHWTILASEMFKNFTFYKLLIVTSQRRYHSCRTHPSITE
jgi:hypothetical protein